MKFKKYLSLVVVFLTFFIFSCEQQEDQEEESVVSDSWISEIDSIEEDEWSYILDIKDDNSYTAVSDDRILNVDKNGGLLSNINAFANEEEEGFYSLRRFYNNKIYSFKRIYSLSSEDYTSDGKIELNIYDDSGRLLENLELDTEGNMLRDVEVEDENTFGMVFFNPIDFGLTLKKVKKNEGVVREILIHSSSSSSDLHISETGEYFCTRSTSPSINFYMYDNELNLQWSKAFVGMLIHRAEFVPGKGIYITGLQSSSGLDRNFIALISVDGEELFRYEYESNNDDWYYEMWPQDLKVSLDGTKIAVFESVVELATHSRVLLFDEDLNLESSLVVEGNVSRSNLVENENGSFSFIHGIKADPEDTESFPITNPRIIKLNKDFVLPETYIYQ